MECRPVDIPATRSAFAAASGIEEVFGWIKAQAGLAKTKLRGRLKVEAQFTFATLAYNLIRLSKLLVQST